MLSAIKDIYTFFERRHTLTLLYAQLFHLSVAIFSHSGLPRISQRRCLLNM